MAGVAGWAKTRRRRRQTVGAISAGVAEELRRRQINRNDCVPRALAVFALATRSGRSATFVSGVTRDGADLVGHAWVVVEGRPLGATDAAGRTYEPQFCYSNEGEEVRPG